jgi:hypothetical protein
MQGSKEWAEKSEFFVRASPDAPIEFYVFRTGGTDSSGTNRALRSGPARGCKVFTQPNSAARHVETSLYKARAASSSSCNDKHANHGALKTDLA